MPTPATLDQSKKLLDLFRGATRQQLQNLLSNGDLLRTMLDADLSKVDRSMFGQLLESQDATLESYPSSFSHLLSSLSDQRRWLLQLNDQLPEDLRVPRWMIQNLESDSDHVQSLDDLEFFFVVKPTLKETWRYNEGLMRLTHPLLYTSDVSETTLSLQRRAYQDYEPGVYRVRINLLANWNPHLVRSTWQVLNTLDGTVLAAIEPIAAYALQRRELLRAQDGEELPFVELLGLKHGIDLDKVPWLGWSGKGTGKVHFGSFDVEDVHRVYAAPTLHGVPSKVA